MFFNQNRVADDSWQAEPPQSVELYFCPPHYVPDFPHAGELENVLVELFVRLEKSFDVPGFCCTSIHVDVPLDLRDVRHSVPDCAFESAGLEGASNESCFFNLLKRDGGNITTHLRFYDDKP
jgi:hypothetical protein